MNDTYLNMKPPSADELAGTPPRMLDEETLLKHFLGKTADDALQLIREKPFVSEDFAYMHPAGLLLATGSGVSEKCRFRRKLGIRSWITLLTFHSGRSAQS